MTTNKPPALQRRRQRKETAKVKNHYKNYSTIDHERKVFAAVMIVILLALITLFVLEVCGVFDGQVWKPVEEFPIANANISWEQTFYPGGFT